MANKNKKSSGSPGDDNRNEQNQDEPVVRDKRRIDPETGEVRHPESETTGPATDATAENDGTDSFTEEDLAFLTDLAAEGDIADAVVAPESNLAAERLADLQRLQAEYVNYRKRVQRDRETARENAIAEVVKGLLPILDDLDRAHAHGDLEGTPLDLVAQKLRASFERYGLTAVGAKGDVFDHNLHEAIYQQPSSDVTVNTVADVIESGYLLGEKLLRPAKVAVDVPAQ
ncbi:nucleotide exchange factor GrpE [Parafrigoribacterium mesophilum]|uniref:nucleotide exchange factor GrpE n=1 Tax=Parafrigoribacterium mesophilum TaxID=433646 RepID=UPI0031FDB7A1